MSPEEIAALLTLKLFGSAPPPAPDVTKTNSSVILSPNLFKTETNSNSISSVITFPKPFTTCTEPLKQFVPGKESSASIN